MRITRPFGLSRRAVTRGQFRRFVEETGYQTLAERDGYGGMGETEDGGIRDPRFNWSSDLGFPQTDEHPVVNVCWDDAVAFCRWLSQDQGVKYELPTEAQWEHACRAGTTTAWHWGDSDTTAREYAWVSVRGTRPGGQLKPNAWGLHDMPGNAWEWCADRYGASYYEQSPQNDPVGPSAGSSRVVRGGSWVFGPTFGRSAARNHIGPSWRNHQHGFRVAMVLEINRESGGLL